MMTKVPAPRRLRAARTATRNGLSSMLRLARPLDGRTRQVTIEAETLVRLADAPRPRDFDAAFVPAFGRERSSRRRPADTPRLQVRPIASTP